MRRITIAALVLVLGAISACGFLSNLASSAKDPAQLLSVLLQVERAKIQTAADLKALRDAAPAAYDAADRDHSGSLSVKELGYYLRDGKLPAREAFLALLRKDVQVLRQPGVAQDLVLADKIDAILADADGWLLLLDLLGA